MQETKTFSRASPLPFDNLAESWDWLVNTVIQRGDRVSPRNMPTRELCNVTIEYPYSEKFQYTFYNPVRNLNPVFSMFELFYFLNSRSDGLPIQYTKQMTNYINSETNRFDGSYGPALYDGLPKVIRLLEHDRDTRRAVIPILRLDHLDPKSLDIPCNVVIELRIRNSRLEMTTVTRSQDLYRGFILDTLTFQLLQFMLAKALNLEVGSYGHFLFSLHLYEKDAENALAATGKTESNVELPTYKPNTIGDFWSHARRMNLIIERPSLGALVFDDMSNAIHRYDKRIPSTWEALSEEDPNGIYTKWVDKWLGDKKK